MEWQIDGMSAGVMLPNKKRLLRMEFMQELLFKRMED